MLKNIGIFTHDLYPYKPWGQGRYVYDLSRHMRLRYPGKILIFSPSPGIDDPHHVEVFSGSHASAGKNITFSLKLGLILEDLIEKYDLGLIHCQGGAGGIFLTRKPPVPVVYTVHHTYYQQATYINSQSWKKLLFFWEKFSYRNSDFLICDSPSTQRALDSRYDLRTPTAVIFCGVDQAQFRGLDMSRTPNSIFFMGRLETRKGIDFLVKSLPLVKARCENVRLYIAGSGILRPQLERMVEGYGLDRNVSFLGVLPDDAVNEWYNKVSLVVVPSIFEGFGLNAAEAMACGTPVVATDVDGLRDVVEDGVSGRLVPFNDMNALSESILSLLTDDAERQRLAENGKHRAKTMFNWENISQQVLAVYQSVLNE